MTTWASSGFVLVCLLTVLLMFLSIASVVIAFIRWDKSKLSAKLTMGCAVLGTLFGSTLCSILACIILFSYSGDNAVPANDELAGVDEYFTQNSAELHDIGATLFADAVAERNQDKLFEAIEYLEKACAGDPDSKAITVDLADAYMEADSPSLTTMAIVLYESVFDSFENDPLLARITAGYQQLGNYEAAYALSEKRLECCPDDMRSAAAVQMGFIAMSSGKMEQAESAILANIRNRGDDPSLRLVVVSLMQSRGDKAGALSAVEQILASSNEDLAVQAYALKVKASINDE
ncbi:MAG: hypothetical protein JW808_07175 [Victivallales bacterium]|nr:hypothetical protein [Victivallales bacterium]